MRKPPTLPWVVGILGIFLSSSDSFAQSVSRLRQSLLNMNYEEVIPEKRSEAKWSGNIRIETMHYLTALAENPHLNYSQFFSSRLAGQKYYGNIQANLDVSAGTFFYRSQSHFVLHEAYGEIEVGKLQLSLGRKKMTWSELDEWAKLGMWQPKFAMDALRPDIQGLSGLFLNLNQNYYQVTIFYSPIFVPSMGAEIREEGGELVADSRWYRSPSREFQFTENQPNLVMYKLNLEDVFRLLGSQGYGASLHLGHPEVGWSFRLSGGYKPMNELVLRRQVFKAATADQVAVTVSPTVGYHALQSLDVGYKGRSMGVGFSALEDFPEVRKPPQDWVQQKLEGVRVYGLHVDWNPRNGIYESLVAQLGLIQVEGGHIQDILSSGESDEFTIFLNRSLHFRKAAQLKLEGVLTRLYGNPFMTRMKYLVDEGQKGSILGLEFLFFPSASWAFIVGGDVLSSEAEESSDSFINQFRANDRVYGGMTYVF